MPAKKTITPADGTAAVNEYMAKLVHPLKDEIQAVREIILAADKNIAERVKWNAPSFYHKEDMVTFNHRTNEHVHLVFHHPHIVNIQSPLLEGDYKDRRMTYLKDMAAVKANKAELTRIIIELVRYLDANLS